jgi:hypothetical protein
LFFFSNKLGHETLNFSQALVFPFFEASGKLYQGKLSFLCRHKKILLQWLTPTDYNAMNGRKCDDTKQLNPDERKVASKEKFFSFLGKSFIFSGLRRKIENWPGRKWSNILLSRTYKNFQF